MTKQDWGQTRGPAWPGLRKAVWPGSEPCACPLSLRVAPGCSPPGALLVRLGCCFLAEAFLVRALVRGPQLPLSQRHSCSQEPRLQTEPRPATCVHGGDGISLIKALPSFWNIWTPSPVSPTMKS